LKTMNADPDCHYNKVGAFTTFPMLPTSPHCLSEFFHVVLTVFLCLIFVSHLCLTTVCYRLLCWSKSSPPSSLPSHMALVKQQPFATTWFWSNSRCYRIELVNQHPSSPRCRYSCKIPRSFTTCRCSCKIPRPFTTCCCPYNIPCPFATCRCSCTAPLVSIIPGEAV
jgi:hypothetical protein